MNPIKFIASILFFSKQIHVTYCSKYIGLSRQTICNLHHYFRKCIAGHELSEQFGFKLDDNNIFNNSIDKDYNVIKKPVVIGINEIKNKVKIDFSPTIKFEELLQPSLDKSRINTIIYTDQYKNYDSLIIIGLRRPSIKYEEKIEDRKLFIDIEKNEFWKFINPDKIFFENSKKDINQYLLFFKELEFRYNNRYTNIYDKLSEKIIGKPFQQSRFLST